MNAQPNTGMKPTTFDNPMGIDGFEFVEFAAPAGQGGVLPGQAQGAAQDEAVAEAVVDAGADALDVGVVGRVHLAGIDFAAAQGAGGEKAPAAEVGAHLGGVGAGGAGSVLSMGGGLGRNISTWMVGPSGMGAGAAWCSVRRNTLACTNLLSTWLVRTHRCA